MRTGDEVRRLAIVKRPVRGGLLLLGAVAALAVIVAAGRGGGEDGALGVAMALAVLVGGAVFIQRVSQSRLLFGFNPDGFWTPSAGWLGWNRIRHIEVRRTQSLVAGRRLTLWVRYLVEGDDEHEAWLAATPGIGQRGTLGLVEEMERCWRAAARPAPRRLDP